MDVIAGLLDGPRAHRAFLQRTRMRPPWSVRVEDRAPLSVVAVVRGDAWVTPAGGSAVRVGLGDVAITRGPGIFTFSDLPDRAALAIIHPGQRCTTPDGEDLHLAMSLGVRTWGNDRDGPADLLVGTYQLESEVSGRLLRALPPLVVVAAGTLDDQLVALLAAEMARDEPGQEAVLDRLLDLLLIACLRVWFARPDAETPAWYRAQGDPVVGRALRLLYSNPSHRWTVASLAAEAGVSRAALARRFTELVGEPPMSYLTGWRLTLAADLLREPDTTVGAVARQVGYSSPYALSTAFKRFRGVSPREHRLAAVG